MNVWASLIDKTAERAQAAGGGFGGDIVQGPQPEPLECRECGQPTLVQRWLGQGGGWHVSHWCADCSGVDPWRTRGAYKDWDAYKRQEEESRRQRIANSGLPPLHPQARPHPGFLNFSLPCDGPDDLWCGLIVGRRGTGRRTQASAVGHWYLSKGWKVLYTTEALLLEARKPDSKHPRDLDHFIAPDLLILVGLGSEARTQPRQEAVRQVLDRRYASRRPTLLTCRRRASDIPRAWPEWEGTYLQIVEGCGGMEAMKSLRLRYVVHTWCYALSEDVGPPDKWQPQTSAQAW